MVLRHDEGAAAGEVGLGVDVDGDGVVVVAEDGDAFGEAALDHGAAFVDDDDAGSFEPDAVDGFDGVVLAAIEVFDLIFGECDVALVGDLVAGVVDPDLDDVDLLAGEDHALVGEEADALGFGTVWVRRAWAGELVDGGEVDDDAGGCCPEEAAEMADHADVAAVEPGVAAEGFKHLVEEFSSALLLGLIGGVGGAGAGDVSGLGAQEGRGDGEQEADRDAEA